MSDFDQFAMIEALGRVDRKEQIWMALLVDFAKHGCGNAAMSKYADKIPEPEDLETKGFSHRDSE